MISCQYVWENLQKHSRSLFARGKSGYVERIKTAQGIVCTDARGPSHRNALEERMMDKACVTHDSRFGNSTNARERPQTLDDAAAKRSEMFRERRYIRELIEKSAFTRAQRAVIRAFVDHWFYHRAKGGVVHPGREKLAKKARCTIKTVSRTLDALRAVGAIEVVSSLNGHGQEATRYKVNESGLRRALGEPKCPVIVYCEPKCLTKWRDKKSHSLTDVDTNGKSPSQEIEFGNVVPFIGKGG